MDQTEAVKASYADGHRNLPEEAEESDHHDGNMASRDPKNHQERDHCDIEIAKATRKAYQICNNLKNTFS